MNSRLRVDEFLPEWGEDQIQSRTGPDERDSVERLLPCCHDHRGQATNVSAIAENRQTLCGRTKAAIYGK